MWSSELTYFAGLVYFPYVVVYPFQYIPDHTFSPIMETIGDATYNISHVITFLSTLTTCTFEFFSIVREKDCPFPHTIRALNSSFSKYNSIYCVYYFVYWWHNHILSGKYPSHRTGMDGVEPSTNIRSFT